MKILLYFFLPSVVVGFCPMQHATRLLTSRSMGMLDDWKTFFSPEEIQHRKQDHEREMEEMRASQKEVLDRRRDPIKMNAYHQQEERRHEQFDRKHDIDIEQEVAKEWIVGEQPLIKPAAKVAHSVFDDLKHLFSTSEKEPKLETVKPNLPTKLPPSLNKSIRTKLADVVPQTGDFEKEPPELKAVESSLPFKQRKDVHKSMETALSDVVYKKTVVEKEPELKSVDISIPYDAPAALAYKSSDRSMAYSDFKLKFEADAVADVISKRRFIEKESEVVTADVSTPHYAPAEYADEDSDANFKLKYEAGAAADVISTRPSTNVSIPFDAPAKVVDDSPPARGNNAPARGKAKVATNLMGAYLESTSSKIPASGSALSATFSPTTATNPIGGYLDNRSGATSASSSSPSASSRVTTATNPTGNMRSTTSSLSSVPSVPSPVMNATNPMGDYHKNIRGTIPASISAPSASSPVTTLNPMGVYLKSMSSATAVSSSAQSESSPVMTASNSMGGYLENTSSTTLASTSAPSVSKNPTNPLGVSLDNMSGTTPASSSSPSASFQVETPARSMGGYWDNMSSVSPDSSIATSAYSPATTVSVNRSSSVSTISNVSSGGVQSKGVADLKQKYEDDAVADVMSRKHVFVDEPKVETADVSVPYDVIQDLYQYLDDVQKYRDHPSVWMPRPLELSNMGRDDLAQAIESFGGFDKICKLAGLVPFREWSNFEGQYELLLELRKYLNLYHGGDQTYFPPESDIKRHGYDQLYSLVQFYGGSESLANRLGMSSENVPRQDSDFNIDAAIELFRFMRADQMKKKGPMKSPVIALPTQKNLLANGHGRLYHSIMELGGYKNVARRLGLDFVGKPTPSIKRIGQ